MKEIKSYSFEYNVFNWLLHGSVIFWVYRIAIHFLFEDNAFDMTIDIVTLFITIAFILSLRIYKNYSHLILIYSALLIIGFVHFWYRLGGLSGSISYSYFALITFFIIILPKKLREVIAVIFCGFTILLSLNIPDSLFSLTPLTPSAELLLPFDFVINSMIIAIIVVLVKRNFDFERNLLEKNTSHVKKISKQQLQKTKELINQQENIKSIKENLELLVLQRTSELELKNKQLEEYAFHNAHLVRKPLSNIIGLISILEMEKSEVDKKELSHLKNKVNELDIITKKINTVLQ